MTTTGITGAGEIGSQIARVAIANGYHVVIANSRGPETLATLIDENELQVVELAASSWNIQLLLNAVAYLAVVVVPGNLYNAT